MRGISLGADRATFEAYEGRVEARNLRAYTYEQQDREDHPASVADEPRSIRCARCAMPADGMPFWALADGTCCGTVPMMWPGVIDHGVQPF